MSTAVLTLGDAQAPHVSRRCWEYAGFLHRLGVISGVQSTLVAGPTDPSAALTELAAAATLTTNTGSAAGNLDELYYVPSRSARERVGTEQDGTWPQSVSARHRKIFRRSPGAILTFHLEPGTAEQDTGSIEAFITDWSPSPAACAIAIHPAHPLSPGLPSGQAGLFTGQYCRHPLTGDLLPIWVASWVKPEFGTGVVLVNPGHDEVDLAFGRQVGLPIRFALAPAGYDGSPAGWLVPPVLKTGVAVRTGATDGLPYDQARTEYFAIMAGRGLAAEYTDLGAGSFVVAQFADDGTAKIGWDAGRGTVVEGGNPRRLSASPLLAAVDPKVRDADLVVVAPSKSTETDVFALRLLLAEPALGAVSGKAPDVYLVGGLTGRIEDVAEPTLRLALLVGAAAQETLSIKPQQIEAAERFLTIDAELAGREPDEAGKDSAEVAKAAVQVKGLLQRRDTRQAFTQLYRLQKTVAKAASASRRDLLTYSALAQVMTGADHGADPAVLAAAWQAI